LEENPWEVFETIFGEGSVHQGTIIETKDKAGIVALPYGVEGICPSKHLKKEDGTNAKVEETLDFKVIEFNKDSKKIVVSHTRTFEEGEDRPTAASTAAGKAGAKKGGNAGAGSATSQAVKAINSNSEKSTLGDLDALSALKKTMEEGEGK
jgi:small subunit ribosomal protein S1